MTVVIDPAFNPVPSLSRQFTVSVAAEAGEAAAVAHFVTSEGELPADLPAGLDRAALGAAGFEGKSGQTLLVPGTPLRVLAGVGEGLRTVAAVRDAAATVARAVRKCGWIAFDLRQVVESGAVDAAQVAEAVIEGAILALYHFDALKAESNTVELDHATLIVDEAHAEAVEHGGERGLILARTASLARDLANTPPRHMSAARFADTVARLAPQFGLEVEVFDRAALIELGCGGLLGVNAGSTDEPRMVKVRFRPPAATDDTPHLALVGKGIMYDSGGISLKPSNAMHATMKLDMMGAAGVFAAMTALRELAASTQVTGWLMCTDNMPSGSATKLGDVLTIRGGTTVEVKNTDAEGRLVLADGLVLATEEERRPDAIVDLATLTGSALMALGTRTAAMLANNDDIAAQLEAAANRTDESVWRLPLDHRYRDQLKSDVADLSNIGGQYAGAILAALFLHEFVDGLPWGHLDIAGTMHAERDDLWRSTGSTGFGARLLAEFAAAFTPPAASVDAEAGRESETE